MIVKYIEYDIYRTRKYDIYDCDYYYDIDEIYGLIIMIHNG